MKIAFDIAVDVFKALRRQRRTGGEQGFEMRQLVRHCRLQIELGDGVDVFGGGAEDADVFGFGVIP